MFIILLILETFLFIVAVLSLSHVRLFVTS